MTLRPEVATDAGRVQGVWRRHRDARGYESTYATFRGIPFAEAPVGALRFAAPVPAAPWDGVRDAEHFGPTAQKVSPHSPPRVPEPSIPGHDILTVNVTTPDPSPDAQLPVLLWIHGGGFEAGSPASPWYVGEAFARDGVVTATVGYRLGFEGFGWLDDAGTGGVVNNRGVLDWIAALEWVQRNIAAFGGDPSRVTIAGQSAGGAAVMRLLTMPSAQHLFAQVLAISPADASSPWKDTALASQRLAAAVGCETTSTSAGQIDEMAFFDARAASALPAPSGSGWIQRAFAPLPLAPAVDGQVCPSSVTDALREGVGADKPLFISATLHEFNVNSRGMADALAGMSQLDALTYAGLPEDLAREYAREFERRGEVRRGPEWAVGQLVGDAIFRGPVARWASLRGEGPTWAADFHWESRSPEDMGAAHCVDLPFGFDILGTEGVDFACGEGAPQALADAVHGDWLSFIAHGSVDAPRYAQADQTVIYTASGERVVSASYGRERRLIDTLA